MNTMLRWSPTRKFHYHHDVDDMFLRFFDGVTDEAVQRAASWLPAAEGRIEDGTYIIQLALPGVDPKDVAVPTGTRPGPGRRTKPVMALNGQVRLSRRA